MINGCPKREPIFRVFRAQVPMTHRPPPLRTARNSLFLNILTSSLRETPPGKVLEGFQMINGYPKREPIFPYFGPVTGRPPVLRTARNSPFLNIGTSSLRGTSPGKVPDGSRMKNGCLKREPIFPYFGPVTGRPPVLRTARNSPFLNIGTSSLRGTSPGKVPDGSRMKNRCLKREPIFPYFGPVTGRPPVLRTARDRPFLKILISAKSKTLPGKVLEGFPMRNRHSKIELNRPFFLRT